MRFRSSMARNFFSGVSRTTLSTPGALLPWFSVIRLTAIALPENEWVSSHCKAFTLLQRPSCVAFTMRACSLLTSRWQRAQSMRFGQRSPQGVGYQAAAREIALTQHDDKLLAAETAEIIAILDALADQRGHSA